MTDLSQSNEADRMKRIIGDSKVVIMCGVSGSGKTYMSKIIETFGFVRISSDEMIWKKYGPEIFKATILEQKSVSQKIGADLERSLEQLLGEGKRVVVDSTMCKRSRRDSIRRLCGNYGISPLIIYFDVTFDVLRSRLTLRKGMGPDDLIVDSASLESYYANFEKPQSDECFFRY